MREIRRRGSSARVSSGLSRCRSRRNCGLPARSRRERPRRMSSKHLQRQITVVFVAVSLGQCGERTDETASFSASCEGASREIDASEGSVGRLARGPQRARMRVGGSPSDWAFQAESEPPAHLRGTRAKPPLFRCLGSSNEEKSRRCPALQFRPNAVPGVACRRLRQSGFLPAGNRPLRRSWGAAWPDSRGLCYSRYREDRVP